MKYEIVTTVLGLLSSIRTQDQEARLINHLDNFFRFDHNIFLFKTSTDPDRYIPSPNDAKVNADASNTPNTVIIVNDDSITNITGMVVNVVKSTNLFLIVVEDHLIHGNFSQLFYHVLTVRQVDIQVKIGIFVTENVESMDQVLELFQWSWRNQILNIFCAFYSSAVKGPNSEPLLNVFNFNSFGRIIDLVNITGSESIQNYFPNRLTNLRKYPIRLIKIEGTPTGVVETNVWDNVIRVLNMSIIWSHVSEANHSSRKVEPEEILVHAVATREDTRYVLYPLLLDTYVIVVPHATPYSDFVIYLKNETWGRLFAYVFVVIALTTLTLIATRYWTKKKILLFQSVADIFNLLMNDNGAIRYDQLHFAENYVVVPLTFTGLIAVNGIVSIFQSYLTVPIYQSQINTIKDLFRSTVPIVADEGLWAELAIEVLEGISNHSGWMDKVHPLVYPQFLDQISLFNRSIAFCNFNSHVKNLLEAQKRLGMKAYYVIPGVTADKFFFSFQIHQHHVLLERLNDIIHRMKSAGLIALWHDRSSEVRISDIMKKNAYRRVDFSLQLSTDNVSIPSLLWYGWIASVIVFMCEIICSKVKPK